MVRVFIDDDKLTFELQGLSKLYAPQSHREIPLAHIRGVHVNPVAVHNWWKSLRASVKQLLNLFITGAFCQDGKRFFWAVKNPEKTIVIDLEGEPYDQLIVQVADPLAVVNLIDRAIYRFAA